MTGLGPRLRDGFDLCQLDYTAVGEITPLSIAAGLGTGKGWVVAEGLRAERRPWGGYQVLETAPDHSVKVIDIDPGKRLSLQRHARRSEHWVVVSGQARVVREEEEILLGAGESVDIPLQAKHRIGNPGTVPLVFIEVQFGDYFGEDDIERFEDDFGRV